MKATNPIAGAKAIRKPCFLLAVLLLVGTLVATSCITINPPPAQAPAPTPMPTPTETAPKLPSIQTFVAPESVPPMNPLEFATARQRIDETFVRLFGETYYANHPNLVNYYEPHDIVKLRQALEDLKKLTTWQYKADYFDCSEMSALTQYALQAAGFETLIVVGYDVARGERAGHAWVVVILRTQSGVELVPVEATSEGGPAIPRKGERWPYKLGNQVRYQTYDDYVSQGYAMQNIYQAEQYCPGDFDWWNSCQIDTSWFKRGSTPAPIPTPTPTPAPTPTPTPTPTPSPTPVKKPLSVYFEGWYITGPTGGVKVTSITKGSSVNALISVSGGESGEYTMRIRRDILGGTDETVKSLSFSYNGIGSAQYLSFIPPYATGEASTDGYHLDLVKDSYTLWTLTDAYPPRLRVTLPPPTPTPPPAPSQYQAKVMDETITVTPGVWKAYSVAIDLTKTPNCRITGSFSASGGSGNDIEFLVFNESNYKKWKYEMESTTGSPASIPALYRSGRVTRDSFDISVSSTDTYYLVWSNHFSTFSNKAVKVQVYLTYSK